MLKSRNVGALVGAVLSSFLVGCASGPEEGGGPGTPCHPTFAKRAYNRPYKVKGNWYYPQGHYEYGETGVASYYGGTDVFHGRPTSNGEIFDKNKVTAAHKTLPIPCVVRVTNLKNGRSITVTVNDRGPFKNTRIIDLSLKAAQMLGFHREGLAQVRVETCVEESLALARQKAANVKNKQKPAPKAHVHTPPKKAPVLPRVVREKEGLFVQVSSPLAREAAHRRAHTYLEKFPHVGVSLGATPSKHYRVLLGPLDSSEEAHNLLSLLKRTKG